MTETKRTGRVIRVLSQVAEEEKERKRRHKEWVEDMKQRGCSNPEDPIELARWQAQEDKELEEAARDYESFERFMREDEEELQRIRESRPLGVPPPIEPKSIHSRVPDPPWKRKLRP